MAVQIPQLNPLEPTQPQSVGRTRADLPDLVTPMARQSRAAESLLGAGVQYAQKVEQDAADTEATRKAISYETYYKQQLYGDGEKIGVKFQEGDPTVLYKTLDEDLIAKFNELTGDENLTGYSKDLVIKRLTEKANQLELNKLSEYGYQNAKYENQVAESAVAIEKQSLTDSAAFIKLDDPESFAPFDAAIGRIRDLRLRNGMKFGSVVPDDNGKSLYVGDDGKPVRVNVGASTDYQLKKDLSEGLYDAMDNAVKSGNLGVANALKEKYGQYLEPLKRKSFDEDLKKANIDRSALIAADQVRGASPEEIDKKLSKLSPEARDKAYQAIDDRQRHQDQIRNRSSKNNYNQLMGHVQSVMNSSDPYAGQTQLEADPLFKNMIDKVTDPKQRKAIYDAVIQPKESSPEAVSNMQNLLFGKDENHPDIRQVDSEDFRLYLSGLSKSDQNKYTRKYEQLKTETGAQEVARYRTSGQILEDQLIKVGYIKRDDYGRIRGSDEKKYIAAKDELINHLDKTEGAPMSVNDLTKYINGYATSKKTGEAFQPIQPQKFQGTKKTKASDVPVNDNTALVKGKTRKEWVSEYYKVKGKLPNLKTNELQDFIKVQE